MLRNLFILVCAMGFMFVIYSAMAQDANAVCEDVCEVQCLVTPTCQCAYGGRAYNHTRQTACIFDETPCNTSGSSCNGLTFAPEADCDENEAGIVIPPSLLGYGPAAGEGIITDYCRIHCENTCAK